MQQPTLEEYSKVTLLLQIEKEKTKQKELDLMLKDLHLKQEDTKQLALKIELEKMRKENPQDEITGVRDFLNRMMCSVDSLICSYVLQKVCAYDSLAVVNTDDDDYFGEHHPRKHKYE